MTIRDTLPKLHQALFEMSTSKSARSRTTGLYYDGEDEEQKAVVAIIDWMNDNEKKLWAEMERLAGTKPWESYHASMRFAHGTLAGINLICNQKEGSIVTMDRADVLVHPPRRGEGPFEISIKVNRLVRNTDYQQEADNEEEARVYADVPSLDAVMNVKTLLKPTASFWKKVEKLSPKK